MLYLGIDLHLKQMTVSLRNEDGDVALRRQVSTRWPKLEEFREQLRQVAAPDEKYVAIVEVCGFHDWLVKWLQQDERCHLVLVVQALGRLATKTDRRDANALSELLWINRERLLRGDRVHGVRTVHQPGEEQLADRRLTATQRWEELSVSGRERRARRSSSRRRTSGPAPTPTAMATASIAAPRPAVSTASAQASGRSNTSPRMARHSALLAPPPNAMTCSARPASVCVTSRLART